MPRSCDFWMENITVNLIHSGKIHELNTLLFIYSFKVLVFTLPNPTKQDGPQPKPKMSFESVNSLFILSTLTFSETTTSEVGNSA